MQTGVIRHYLVHTIPIQNSSWLDDLTRGKQYVRFAYKVDQSPEVKGPALRVYVTSKPCVIRIRKKKQQFSCPVDNAKYTQANDKVYGLSVDTADVEAIVPRRPRVRRAPSGWHAHPGRG